MELDLPPFEHLQSTTQLLLDTGWAHLCQAAVWEYFVGDDAVPAEGAMEGFGTGVTATTQMGMRGDCMGVGRKVISCRW